MDKFLRYENGLEPTSESAHHGVGLT